MDDFTQKNTPIYAHDTQIKKAVFLVFKKIFMKKNSKV